MNELKQIRKYLRMKRPKMKTPRGNGTAAGRKGKKRQNILSTKLEDWGDLENNGNTPDDAEICLCNNKKQKSLVKERLKEERMKQREERKQKRLARKERKRVRQEKRKAKKGKHEHCDADAKMNCFRFVKI